MRQGLENYSIYPAPYTVGPEAYKKIPEICGVYGRRAVVIGGETAISKARSKLEEAVRDSEITILDYVVYGKECTHGNAKRAEMLPAVLEADFVLAVGGGKAVDTVKLICMDLEKPFFTLPTIVSNCAASSAVAIVYNDDSSFLGFEHLELPSRHVFIDTEICAAAPREFLWAGIGDTYAKYYEVSISAKGESLPHYLAMGVQLSRLCWDTLEEHGRQALEENIAGIPGYAFEQAALAIVITTGYVSMLVAREHSMIYNGGVAHAFFYGLTALPGFEENHLHGVVVGFGVLLTLLIDGQEEEAERLAAFNRSIGIPTRLSEVDVTLEQVAACAEAMTRDEDLEHYPYRVTAEMIVEAARRLDV